MHTHQKIKEQRARQGPSMLWDLGSLWPGAVLPELLVPPLPAQLLYFLHTKHSMPFHQSLRLQINHLHSKLHLDLRLMTFQCCTRMLTHPLSVCMWLLSNLLPAAFCLICLLTGWFVYIFGDGFWIGIPGWPQTCSNPASGSWMPELQVLSLPGLATS